MRKYLWLAIIPSLILGVTFVFLLRDSGGSHHGISQEANRGPSEQTTSFTVAGEITSRSDARAAVDEETHDFGVMNPDTDGEYVFKVRNEGDAPLQLRRGSTSCKCTLSKISEHSIPPGNEGRVVISWHTLKDQAAFNHSATVFTNDPNNSTLTFHVKGLVKTLLGMDPPQVVFPGISSRKKRTAEVLVYSQTWPEFTVSKIDLSHSGWTCRLEPADAEALLKHNATAGYRLLLTTPDNLRSGYFSHWLRLHVDPGDNVSKEHVEELALAGEVLAPISLYGKNIKGGKVLNLGVLQEGESRSEVLMLVVRDEHRQFTVRQIKALPECLKIQVHPLQQDGMEAKAGLYHITVEVPADAPSCNYMGVNRGEIEIITDHPRIHNLQFQVELAITKRPSKQNQTAFADEIF